MPNIRTSTPFYNEVLEKIRNTNSPDQFIHWIICCLYLNRNVSESFSEREKVNNLDHLGRKLFKKIFFGAYGPAGIIYSIEGSPPRGIIIVTEVTVTFIGFTQLFKKSKTFEKYELSTFHSSKSNRVINELGTFLMRNLESEFEAMKNKFPNWAKEKYAFRFCLN